MIRLSRRQVREVDRRAIEEFGVPGVVLMENASRSVAEVAWEELEKASSRKVLILCGGGNNGGDGLAAARHLHNFGAEVVVGLFADPAKYRGEALVNWEVVRAMKLRTVGVTPEVVRESDVGLIVDALFGTGLTSPARDPFPELVRAIEAKGTRVLAVDLPSGLDCDTGAALGSALKAAMTVTFVAEKLGFANPDARAYTGAVTVADIGCPREIIAAVLRDVPVA